MKQTLYVVGNWKMHGTQQQAHTLLSPLVQHLKKYSPLRSKIVICPPYTLLQYGKTLLGNAPIFLGAQDCHESLEGAYTGAISPAMLIDSGCHYVITGHSERRYYCQETDAVIKNKSLTAIRTGLTPIICVGEQEKERDAGEQYTVVEKQLRSSLPMGQAEDKFLVAYEPVWAIGTGKTASLEIITQMHGFIRQILTSLGYKATPLLYGGSVKAENAKAILAIENVDGVLVGSASLDLTSFLAMIAQAEMLLSYPAHLDV